MSRGELEAAFILYTEIMGRRTHLTPHYLKQVTDNLKIVGLDLFYERYSRMLIAQEKEDFSRALAVYGNIEKDGITPESFEWTMRGLGKFYKEMAAKAKTTTPRPERKTNESPGRGSPSSIPGFTFLEEETFSCGGKSNRIKVYRHLKTGLEFVLVPGETVWMGSGASADEKPVHQVTIQPFLLCRTECTQEAWDRIGGEDSRVWRGKTLPIDGVSWNDCTAWCRKAGLRLPSEAEWEYACRGGKTGNYCYGDDESDLHRYGNYCDRSNTNGFGWQDMKHDDGHDKTAPVKSYLPNAFGLYDMHGNLWEWVQDVYHSNYEGAPTDGSAWEDKGSGFRVRRGGGWGYVAWSCRSAVRLRLVPGGRGCHLGFRPALSLP